MCTIPNQGSLPIAWKMLEDEGGTRGGKSSLIEGGKYGDVGGLYCTKEFVKLTGLQRPGGTVLGIRLVRRRGW